MKRESEVEPLRAMDEEPQLERGGWDLEDSVREVLARTLGREPNEQVVQEWLKRARTLPAAAFLRQLSNSKKFRQHKVPFMNHPPGHFFSPVVDPDTVRPYYEASMAVQPEDIGGIDFRLGAMKAFWLQNQEFIRATPFGEAPTPGNRYSSQGGPYPIGDAITLRAMIGHYKPKKIIEIGSGFSTACMLDAAEHAGLKDLHITCIDPDFTRLRSLLKPGDEERLELHERVVQGMPLEPFSKLQANDILFIDSTHVLKTGSDVHYELFYILPLLKPGVIVHFHDCRFPLEYSPKQVFEKNYSWNEVYAVRALLMYSNRFRVVFHNSLFCQREEELVRETIPACLRNPGSGLWIEVLDEAAGRA
jgi:predicted O-methyltransferase YrrM